MFCEGITNYDETVIGREEMHESGREEGRGWRE
jgi:hypothetical protein